MLVGSAIVLAGPVGYGRLAFVTAQPSESHFFLNNRKKTEAKKVALLARITWLNQPKVACTVPGCSQPCVTINTSHADTRIYGEHLEGYFERFFSDRR